MAVPKKKLSRTRQRRRRSANETLGKLHLVECETCHEPKRPHAICPNCGTYRGVAYLAPRDEDLQ